MSKLTRLFFRRNGQRSDYGGGRNEASITGWIKKKTGPPSSPVDGAALKEKDGKVKRAIAYIGPLEGDLFEAHMGAAKNVALADSFEFFHTSDVSVAEHFGLHGAGVVILRNFDEAVTPYTGAHNAEALAAFAKTKVTARLINFDEDSIEPIFGKKASAIMLFSNENDTAYHKIFAEAADKLQGKILFVKSTTTNGIQQKLADYIGVSAKDTPTIRIIKFQADDL